MTIRDDAYAVIPGLSKAQERLDLALQARDLEPLPARRHTTGHLRDAAIAAAVADVRAGRPIDAAVARPLAESYADEYEPKLRTEVIATVVSKFEYERDSAFASGAGAALEHLSSQLDETLDKVLELDVVLGAVRTASDAEEAGSNATTAWNGLTAHVDAYDDIRAVQTEIVRGKSKSENHYHQAMAVCGYWRDSIDRDAYWVKRRTEAAAQSQDWYDRAASKAYVEWLRAARPLPTAVNTERPSPWWPTNNPHRHLRELARNGTAWVPQLDVLKETFDVAVRATGYVNGPLLEAQWNARARYFELTELEDRSPIPRKGLIPSTGFQSIVTLRPQDAGPLGRPLPAIVLGRKIPR